MTVVIEKTSGGVAVMRLIGDADAAQCIEQWKTANPGEYVSHTELSEDALPDDRSQRAAWKLSGGQIVIDATLLPVPQAVTRRQAKQALALTGLLDQVQPAIDAIPDAAQRALMQIEWDDSQTFQRHRPALLQLAAALGLSEAQIDALFRQAATL